MHRCSVLLRFPTCSQSAGTILHETLDEVSEPTVKAEKATKRVQVVSDLSYPDGKKSFPLFLHLPPWA